MTLTSCLAKAEPVDGNLHLAGSVKGHLSHGIGELASEGCAGEFLCDAG
jgi:hypothetical protein